MLFLDVSGGCDENLMVLIKLVRTIVTYITILVPIILVVIGTFDLLKAVTASKEDEIKSAQKLLIKRIIYAILIFLIVPLLTLIFNLVGNNYKGDSYDADWKDYWNGVCPSSSGGSGGGGANQPMLK